MKTTLSILCFLGTILFSLGQDKNFDLSRYKFPDYKRHEMEFNLRSNGYSDTHSYDELSNSGSSITTRNDYSQIYSHSNFSISYQYDQLTRQRIENLYSSLSGQYNFEKTDVPGEITKQFDPSFNWNFGGFRRYYLVDEKFFLEAGTNLSFNFSEAKRTIGNVDDLQNKQNSISARINLGTGTGRMEMVSDLWQAYYILEKLKENNSIARDLNEKDIFEFAGYVSKLKNKRFFDFRLQKMAELHALDSLLHKQGLIIDSGISYFTALNDYWSFSYFNTRESGKVLKFWLSPEYSRFYYKSLNKNSEIHTKINLVSNLSFDCNKQLNLFWERYLKILLSNETLIKETGPYFNNYPLNLFNSTVEFGYGFFPNERTSISGSLGYVGKQDIFEQTSDNLTKYWSNRIYLGLNGYYYFSPQLQIRANVSYNYTDKIYNSINPRRISYDLSLRYAIF